MIMECYNGQAPFQDVSINYFVSKRVLEDPNKGNN